MLFNIGLFFQSSLSIALLVTTYMIVVNSTMICYIIWFVFMHAGITAEVATTCVMAILAYTVHSSYKCIELKMKDLKRFYKRSVIYIVGLPLLFQIFMISYDVSTGAYQHTILPNGHCSFVAENPYVTVRIPFANIFFNRILQVIFVVAYFTYHYKIKSELKLIRKMKTSNKKKDHSHFKLAVAMTATMGISKIFYFLNGFAEDLDLRSLFYSLGTNFLLLQQALNFILLLSLSKVARLCRERFCKT